MPLRGWVGLLESHTNLRRSKHGHSASTHGQEAHVVSHVDPEPHGVGVPHVGLGDLGEVQISLHHVA